MKRKQKRMTDEELRDWYDRTSEIDQGWPVRIVKMKFTKVVYPRTLVALRLEADALAAIKRIAASKGLNFSTLMRLWITERLQKEIRTITKR